MRLVQGDKDERNPWASETINLRALIHRKGPRKALESLRNPFPQRQFQRAVRRIKLPIFPS